MQARRSIFTKLVLAAIVFTLVLLASLWLLVDQSMRDSINDAAQAQVDTDLAGLVDIYASGGEEELVRRIEDRLAIISVEANTPHYMLANDAGKILAGDIEQWPELDPRVSETGLIVIGEGTQAYARATQLGPELRLLVARETNAGAPILRRVGVVFLGGGTIVLILVALTGRFAATRLQRRIGRINHAFRDPTSDTLEQLPSRAERDEIDELARHSAAVLSRQARLMEAYRDTSDQLAHEIRTPLMHLDRRLVKALEENPSQNVSAGIVDARAEIRRLVSMLESLLDIASSKASAGDRQRLECFDLSAMLTRLCELYADSAEESGHLFSWEISPDVAFEGEQMQLTRMVTNLLDNAFKYVPAGGSVRLSLDAGPRLKVCDNGPGIAESESERVFSRFYRGAAGKAQDAAGGSGLGLALSRAIAERHGLQLTLEDNEPGACFCIAPQEN